MAFELKVLLESFFLPLAVSISFGVIAWLLEARLPATAIGWIAGLGCWCGILAGHTAIVPWSLWPDETWQRLPWPLLIAVLGLAPSSVCCRQHPLRWLASCSLAAAAAWIAIPRDEAWKDMWPEQSTWMAAIVVGTLWNQWSTEDLIDRQAERWGVWVLIGCCFPVFFLSAICYATMAQWVLVCIASAMGIALVGLVHPAKWMSVLAPLLSLMMAAMMAWTRFRGNLQPVWLYLLLLFAPTMIAAVDRLAARRGVPWLRVVVAGVLTIGVSVVTAIQAMPSGHEEW